MSFFMDLQNSVLHFCLFSFEMQNFYGMACYIMYGELPYKYRYEFVRFGKIVEVDIPISKLTEVKNAIKFMYMQMVSYQRQGKYPAQVQEFYCKNFCGYTYLCDRYKQFKGEI